MRSDIVYELVFNFIYLYYLKWLFFRIQIRIFANPNVKDFSFKRKTTI